MRSPKRCKECGGTKLSWQAINTTTSGVQNGRLRLSEVQCQFVLGCDNCSATLQVVHADNIAAHLTRSLEQSK